MSTMQETSTLLEKIRSRGYWRVVIRPLTFKRERIARLQDLFPIVQKCTVPFHTWWEFPQIEGANPLVYGGDWVGQEVEWGVSMGAWRLYQSGLFVHFFAITEDWERLKIVREPLEPDWHPGKELCYIPTNDCLLAIFRFARNLARSAAGDSWMRVEITVEGLAGRRLKNTLPQRTAQFGDYQTHAKNWSKTWDLAQGDFIDKPRDLAAEAAQDLFARFGLHLSVDILKELQELPRH